MVSRERPDRPEDTINQILERLNRLETAAPLRASSVTDGQTRFIGERSIQILGSGDVEGILRIIGELIVSGLLRISGNVDITGPMVIEGDTSISGDTTLDGTMTVPGALPIVLSIVGGVPTLSVGGGEIRGYEDGIRVTAGQSNVFVTPAGATFLRGGWGLGVTAVGPTASMPSRTNVEGLEWVGIDPATGQMFRVNPANGGPTGSGEFAWPFDLSLVTKEYDPNDPFYPSGNGHQGIDFGSGIANVEGTPIPAAAGGTVLANAWDDERGWYVILDHGDRGGYRLTTRYYHLHQQSSLADGATVTKGQTLGGVGTTGLSRGVHLHYETRRDGASMNPRTFHTIYGE